MATIIYHHNDADGIASAAIILEMFSEKEKDEINCISVDYGKEDVLKIEDVKDNSIYIVDFSFPPETMKEIVEKAKSLCWIDHHQTAMKKNPKMWFSKEIAGIRSLKKSGCELAWEWFFPYKEMPFAIKLIGDYDMWQFNYQMTKEFGEGLSLEIFSPKDEAWKDLLSESVIFVNKFINDGKTLLRAKQKRVEKTFRDGHDIEWAGHKCRVMNSNNDVSDTGNYACKQGYDIGMVWSIKNDMVIVGLRSIKDIDVAKIAEKHGGGGHKHASGFNIEINKISLFIDILTNKNKGFI